MRIRTAEANWEGERPAGKRRDGGLSLIEVIGVLAVIAVLAAALFPVVIRRIDLTTKRQEGRNLLVASNALALQALRGGVLSTVALWTNSVELWSGVPAARAVANTRRYTRYYFTHPGVSSAVNGTALSPANARAMIVSVLGGDPFDTGVTLADPRGGALAESEFMALWDTVDGARPATGMFSTWNGSGDDLLIQRVDYAPLFHRLVLVNRDTNNASFRINQGAYATLSNPGPPNGGWDRYYLNGTVLTLGNAANAAMTRCVLTRDAGYIFEGGLWRDQIMGTSSSSSQPDDFAAKAAVFLEADWNTRSDRGADQQGVLSAMYSFMYSYTLWANQRPHFPHHGAPSADQVPEFEMLKDVANDNNFLDVLTKYLADN